MASQTKCPDFANQMSPYTWADVDQVAAQLTFCLFQFVIFLQVHPALSIGAEVACQAQGRVGADA
ncbi:MAG TPA: hypothetical protein VFJ01_13360, partial [Oleiagrimonas sp.]|nr:hypothetical protein [Oleiagrimonas sp.]